MKAVTDSLHNLFTSFARYPLIILSSIIVTRYLGAESKGIYVYLAMMSAVLLPICFFGFANGIIYYISNKYFEVKNVAFTTIVMGCLTGIVVSAIVFALWYFQCFGETGNTAAFYILLPFLMFIPIDGTLFATKFLLTGDDQFQLTNYISLGVGTFSAILLIAFVTIGTDKLLAAVIALNIVKGVNLIVVLLYLFKLYKPALRFNTDFVKKTYSYGIKSWLGAVSARAKDQLDQLIIGMFIGPTQLGIYSVAYAIVNFLLVPSNAFSPVLFNELSKVNSIEKSSLIAAKIHRIFFLLVFLLAIFLGIGGYWLIPLMYGAEFADAYTPFLILLPGLLFHSVTRRVLLKFLSANGMPLRSSLVAFIGSLVGFIFYMLLIPSYGIIGGAIGSTIAYITSAIFAYVIAIKVINGPFPFFSFSIQDIKWLKGKMAPYYRSMLSKVK